MCLLRGPFSDTKECLRIAEYSLGKPFRESRGRSTQMICKYSEAKCITHTNRISNIAQLRDGLLEDIVKSSINCHSYWTICYDSVVA